MGCVCTWSKGDYKEFDCEGPLGFPMASAQAKELETLLREQPADDLFAYRKSDIANAAYEFIENERADVSIITSSTIDRDREIVIAAGVDFKEFRKYPVVTYAHNYSMLPVGRCSWIKREGQTIKAKTRYATRPDGWTGDWLPDAVWHLVKTGDLKGKSIGFLPRKGHTPTPDDLRKNPSWADARWIWDEVILFEYAVCTIQCNPDAVVEAVAKRFISSDAAKTLGFDPATIPILPAGDVDRAVDEPGFVRVPVGEWDHVNSLASKQLDAEIKAAAAPVPVVVSDDQLRSERMQVAKRFLKELDRPNPYLAAFEDAIDRARGRV